MNGPDDFGGEDPPHNDFNAAKALAEIRESGASRATAKPLIPIERHVTHLRTNACAAVEDNETTVGVATESLCALLQENARLREQVKELQAAGTKAKDESLYRRVRYFHVKYGHPCRHTPATPTDEEAAFRMSLVLEEVKELYDAMFDSGTTMTVAQSWDTIRRSLTSQYPFERAAFRFDMEAAYDALLDIAYVVEGTHAVFGTIAEPGIAEVQRANMAKDPDYVAAKDGHHLVPDPKKKPKKPPGWLPPDIRGVLLAQGWVPPPAPSTSIITVSEVP